MATHCQKLKTCERKSCRTPCEFYCTACRLSLCYKCVADHLLTIISEGHNIVHYRDRKRRKIIKPFCSLHKKPCDNFCKTCSVPLCWECCSAFTHLVQNVRITLRMYIKYLQEEIELLRMKIRPKYLEIIEEIKICIIHSKEEHKRLEEKICDICNDDSPQFHVKELQKLAKSHQRHLNKLLRQTHRRLFVTQSAIFEIDKILKQPIRLQTLRDLNIELISKFEFLNKHPDLRRLNSSKVNISEEFSSVTLIPWTKLVKRSPLRIVQIQRKEEFSILNPYRKIEGCYGFWVVTDPDPTKMWIFGGKGGTQYDLHARKTYTLNMFGHFADVMVTKEGSILYLNPKVNFLLRQETESIPSTIIEVSSDGWKNVRITATSQGGFLIFQCKETGERGRVLKYNKNGALDLRISSDGKERPLYGVPRGIMELRNGNICTIDNSRLVTVNDERQIVFEYNLASNAMFPRNICRDQFGYILALFSREREESITNLLIMLQDDGTVEHIFRFYGLENLQITGMNVDGLNRLWIVSDRVIKIINHFNYSKLSYKND